MLDKPTLVKLVCSKAGVSEYKIIDVKIRDTYSFVQVTEDEAEKVWSLKGLTVGTRKINVEVASEEAENKEKKDKNKAARKKESDGADGRRTDRGNRFASDRSKKRSNGGNGRDIAKDGAKRVSKNGKVLNSKGQIQNPKPRGKRTKKL